MIIQPLDRKSRRSVGPRPILRWILTAIVLLLTAQIGLIEAARYLLVANTPLEPADAIIVLGGEPEKRAKRAMALYGSGLAPLVIISGDGDCHDVAERLYAGGVDSRAIWIECQSRNTAENAAFSSTLLDALNVRRTIVVTSWFHSRRALLCFRRATPGVEVLVAWSDPPPRFWRIIGRMEGVQIMKEYLKIVGYWLPLGRRCYGGELR